MNICTIVAKNYLAHARVLASSFREHHPDGECFVLVIDDLHDGVLAADEPFTLVLPDELPLDRADWDDMRAMYSVLEFSTAVKPWLLRLMLDRHDDGSGIAYFDPDIQVHSRMVELEALLRETQIVLTPHLSSPLPRDGKRPAETDIMIAGIYNLGFVGLARGDDSDKLIPWWEERLRRDCWVRPEQGLFVDQKWMDWAPGLFPAHKILRDTTYNVAYWNLPTRKLARDGDRGFTVDDQPLRFFHFSGYSPDRPADLSKHQDRIHLGDTGALREVCDGYRRQLLAHGFEDVRTLPYSHDTVSTGLKVDSVARTAYAKGVERGELPAGVMFADPERFERWLRGSAPETPGLSRYALELWEQRADLQAAYPDPADGDRDGLLGWCAEWGGDTATQLLGDGNAKPTSPPALTEPAFSPQRTDVAPLSGVNVFGYLRSELGVGEVARQLITALDAAAVPVLPFALAAPHSSSADFTALERLRAPHPVNLVCVNADMLPALARDHPELLPDHTTIGYWWWELPEFPEHLHDAFMFVDEVWVGSRYVADAISQYSPVPVVHMPVPMQIGPAAPVDLTAYGVPSDAFTFHFAWDYNSIFRRKNPLGLVAAYRTAFGPDDGACLVLKSINHARHETAHGELLAAIADRPDIIVIDEHLPADQKNGMLAACDCYVSLHRSEGLGLTIVEAMLLGTPVIATDFSGSTDVVTEETGFPVRYRMVDVGPGSAPYDPALSWAEPDTVHAAERMREVFEDRENTARVAEAGRRAAKALHDPAALGRRVRSRLEKVTAEKVTAEADAETSGTDDALQALISRRALPRSPSRFGKAGAAARKAVLRTIKPYTAYQSDINHELLERLQAVEAELAAERERREITDAELSSTVFAELRRDRRQNAEIVEDLLALRASVVEQFAYQERSLTKRGELLDTLLGQLHARPYVSSPVFSRESRPGAGEVLACSGDRPENDGYVAFEDVFRGSEQFITERQRRYLPLLEGHGPVLDIGCGRGELLRLLAEAGIEARGVDLDAGMAARGQAHGVEIAVGDGIDVLRDAPDGSLGTIFSAQVIEHLQPAALEDLVREALRVLRPGGLFIAETVNPHSAAALKTFWVDVTHHHPLFPETMLLLARDAGFNDAFVFHPNGTGDWDHDRVTSGEYAVVARR